MGLLKMNAEGKQMQSALSMQKVLASGDQQHLLSAVRKLASLKNA